jgi:hypothetical protein
MPDVYLRSIELLIVLILGCIRRKGAEADEVRRLEKGWSTNSDDNTKRRLRCPTAPKALDLAEPRDAQFVMASLASSGTTRGEHTFVPRDAVIASKLAGQVISICWAGSWRQRTARGQYDAPDLTTKQGILKNGTDFAPRCPNHD